MLRSLLLAAALLLAACAGTARDSISSPMHDVGGRQIGWEETKAADGNPIFTIRSGNGVSYDAMLEVAESRAKTRCPYGYRVMDLGGGDQPQVDILHPRLVIGGELRFEVQCFERDNF
jgi:hypothetical protein